MSKNLLKLLPALALMAGLAGCADAPYRDEASFGASVRNMVVGQIADPAAAASPPAQAPHGLDGPAAVQVMKTYREPPPKSASTSTPVQLLIAE